MYNKCNAVIPRHHSPCLRIKRHSIPFVLMDPYDSRGPATGCLGGIDEALAYYFVNITVSLFLMFHNLKCPELT